MDAIASRKTEFFSRKGRELEETGGGLKPRSVRRKTQKALHGHNSEKLAGAEGVKESKGIEGATAEHLLRTA